MTPGPRHLRAVLLTTVLVVLNAGACSNRAWYEGLQTTDRIECAKSREDCPERPSYDEYELERKEPLEPRP